MKNFYIFLGNT